MDKETAVLERSAVIKKISDKSLKRRLWVAALLIPLLLVFVFLGGWPFNLFFCLALSLAAWEYWRMFRVAGYAPSLFILIAATVSIFFLRTLPLADYMGFWLSALVLLSLGDAVRQQALNVPNATLNFSFTLSGALYVGWLGSYLVLLRNLPNGLIWTLVPIFAASMSDAGGYLFGSLFGRHRMAPSISPKKTWEGYFGGILVGGLSTWLAAWILHNYIPGILAWQGLVIGVVLSILVPIGDLAESMFKRQFQIKDTSHILPGHGGILDRIDSSLWAIVIGYYLILILT
jgi:phosphatidate cytidylyltransferase